MINRYEHPAQQNVQNTYVPLPYAELAHSLNVKQNEYDVLKQATQQADKEILGIKVPQFIRTSTDYSTTGTVENPQYQILRQAQEQFAQEKENLLNSGIDYTTPEGKKAVSQYVGKVANFRNTAGKQIEQDSNYIEQHNKDHDEYLKKGVHYAGNAYYADRNVDKFLQQGAGFEKTSLNPYQERTKIVGDALDKMKSQIDITKTRDKNGLVTLRDRESGMEVATIQNGKTIWKGVSGERVKNALHGVVDSELDEGIQREAASYRDFLVGKNSDRIFDKNGKVKNVTYKTRDINGKEVELTEPADKYYYNQKYNKLKKDLQDYAINTFVESDVTTSQTNKALSDDFQIGGGKNPATNIPITVTPDASISQTSSNTPAKDALPGMWENLKRGTSLKETEYDITLPSFKKLSSEEKVDVMKENVLSSIKDPNDYKKAEALMNDIKSGTYQAKGESDEDYLDNIANQFDSKWKNVKADIKVNLKPTKTSVHANNAITDFVKRTASGSLVTNQKGEEIGFDPEKDYQFGGAVITDSGVVFNMIDKKNPTDVIRVQNNSDFGSNTLVKSRNQLKQIDTQGNINTNPLLASISGLYPEAVTYKVVTDTKSPTLSSVIMLDKNGKQVDEPVPQEVLDQITIETVAKSIGSSGTGVTPRFK